MDASTPNTALNPSIPSIEFIEESRRQSTIASSGDRVDTRLMAFLDQALLDIEEL